MGAEQGDGEAQFKLGALYYDGRGVDQDFTEAVKWWRKAAEQGTAEAQFNLGLVSVNGNGLPKDRVEAYKWFTLATRQGSEMAAANREALAKTMTPDEILEGRKRADVFVTDALKLTP